MSFSKLTGPQHSVSPRVLNEATGWLLRLEDTDPDSPPSQSEASEMQDRFFAWLGTSAMHVRAFLELSHAYHTLNRRDPPHNLSSPDRPVSGQHSLTQLRTAPPAKPRGRKLIHVGKTMTNPRTVRMLGIGIGLIATATLLWTVKEKHLPISLPTPAGPVYYSTRIGERSIIQLNDGSTMYLNTASRIAVDVGRKRRTVELLSGEALFHVVHGSIPFQVRIDNLDIEALGTQFDVYRQPTATQVSILEGHLRVVCSCITTDMYPDEANPVHVSQGKVGPNLSEVRLLAGQQVQIGRQFGLENIERRTLTSQQREHVIAWRNGQLSFEGQTLADVTREFNRYNRRQMVVTDPRIAGVQIGGVFSAGDLDSFIAALDKTHGIRALPSDPSQSHSDILLVGDDPRRVAVTQR